MERRLGRVGYTVVGTGGLRSIRDYRLHRVGALPPDLAQLRTDPRRAFTVDLDRLTTPVGFSYHPDGWHPYHATLEEYLADPELPYERSTLCRYYAHFRPETVQAALLEHIAEPVEPLCSWPPLLHLYKSIWSLTRRKVVRILVSSTASDGAEAGNLRRPDVQHFGPQTVAAGERHVERLLAAHESLQRHGYRPSEFPNGDLLGYLLVRGDDYRFVVSHGNHRLPAMRRLGIDRVVARLDPGRPPVVNEDDLDRWTVEHGGVFRREVAQQLFDKQFSERGDTKARNLGLLPHRDA